MKRINDNQKELYEKYDYKGSERIFERYTEHLKAFRDRKQLKILDIGGASGYFVSFVKEYFSESNVTVYVIDPVRYDTWSDEFLGKDIHFICDSVENLETLFAKNTFDIIFANRVFHHFVENTWKGTLNGMEKYLYGIRGLLKNNGMLFIMDHFYNGLLFDASTSWLIYHITIIENPIWAKIVKKFGAMTAGVGVCFLSEKMWTEKLEKCGYNIAQIDRRSKSTFNVFKRVCLLMKSVYQDSIMVAVPKDEKA